MKRIKLTKVPVDQNAFSIAFTTSVSAQIVGYSIAPVMCAIDADATLKNIIKFVFNWLLLGCGIIFLGLGIFFLAKGAVGHEQGDVSKGLGFILGGAVAAGSGYLVPKFLGFSSLDSISFE